MAVTIKNQFLQVTVDTLGAQMRSIRGKDGCEYLWQGDPKYWDNQAPVLFPFIGRLQDGKYQLNGKIYSMGLHGFASRQEFAVTSHREDTLVLTLAATAETRENYPYDFVLEITYQLVGRTLSIQNRVKNRSGDTMHFALGGHPGFRVPLEEGAFEDCYLEFDPGCDPDRILFTSDTVLVSGKTERFDLSGRKILRLRHDLFDGDAIILQNMSRRVSLKSGKSPRSITVDCPQMPYLGFWHWPKTDAPYVCIEPWSSLPGRDGVTEEISCRSDFVHLPAGETYENTWTITLL